MNYLDEFLASLSPNQQEALGGYIEALKLMQDVLEKKAPGTVEDQESLYSLRSELIKESDRGLCLLAIGRLEIVMESLWQKKLNGSNTFKKDLFGSNGPLSTFSQKVKLSYAIGLISKGLYDEIDVLRQIRNKFAHSDKPINFDSPEIVSLCGNLKLHRAQSGRTNRKKFISAFLFIVSSMMANIRMAEPFKEKEDNFNPGEVVKSIEKGKQMMLSDLAMFTGLEINPDEGN